MIVHAVPDGYAGLTAVCGASIDGKASTGHLTLSLSAAAYSGNALCPACVAQVGTVA